jgi:hypothetical protein
VIPVDQTLFEEHNGDCFAASVASVLQIPISEVPDLDADDWDDRLHQWAQARGLGVRFSTIAPPGYAVALGTAYRGTGHAVVVRDGGLAHDPMPAHRRLFPPGLKSVDEYVFFR